MSTAVVHYVKHWDNDTKGSIQVDTDNLFKALVVANGQLQADWISDQEGAVDLSEFDGQATITKAEIVDNVQSWTGVPKAGF